MNLERAFLQALIANPNDISCRLIYADWLEERGDARADYLRLECELRALPRADKRRGPVEARLKDLRFTLPQDWLVWVHWLGYGQYAPTLPAVTHHPLPLNGAEMRMPGGVSWVAFSHDGQFIYTCGTDPHIWIWDAVTYELHQRIRTDFDYLHHPALHPTLEQIAAGGADGTVRLWDMETRAEILCAKRHPGYVTAVCFVDSGRLLASGDEKGTVRLTETASGKRVGRLKQVGGRVRRLSALPTGVLVGAVHERGVRVWDAELQDMLRFDGLAYHGGESQSDLTFFNNGESVWVALWGREPFLRIWSLADPTPRLLPAAQFSPGAFAITFSPDEGVAALALQHELILIDTNTQEILARWAVPRGTERHQGPPSALAFSPDGSRLISADVTGGIWVWPVPIVTE